MKRCGEPWCALRLRALSRGAPHLCVSAQVANMLQVVHPVRVGPPGRRRAPPAARAAAPAATRRPAAPAAVAASAVAAAIAPQTTVLVLVAAAAVAEAAAAATATAPIAGHHAARTATRMARGDVSAPILPVQLWREACQKPRAVPGRCREPLGRARRASLPCRSGRCGRRRRDAAAGEERRAAALQRRRASGHARLGLVARRADLVPRPGRGRPRGACPALNARVSPPSQA